MTDRKLNVAALLTLDGVHDGRSTLAKPRWSNTSVITWTRASGTVELTYSGQRETAPASSTSGERRR